VVEIGDVGVGSATTSVIITSVVRAVGGAGTGGGDGVGWMLGDREADLRTRSDATRGVHRECPPVLFWAVCLCFLMAIGIGGGGNQRGN